MASVQFEETVHKLVKSGLVEGKEIEVCSMIIECCSQERTFMRYYGLLAGRFCALDAVYKQAFEKCFVEQYSTIHRLDTPKLRNVASLFSHLLHTDSISWAVFEYIHLNEAETTSSSRIFIKIIFLELAEFLGLAKLKEKLAKKDMKKYYEGIFPMENPKNTIFSVNFFTAIGLGGLTEDMREYLKSAPKPVESDDESSSSSSSDSDSDSDSDSSSSSSSESEQENLIQNRRQVLLAKKKELERKENSRHDFNDKRDDGHRREDNHHFSSSRHQQQHEEYPRDEKKTFVIKT